MDKFWIITKNTFLKNVKSVSFIVMILMPFIFMGFGAIGGYFGSGINSNSKIAIISDKSLQSMFDTNTDFKIDKSINTEKDVEKALEDGKIDGFITLELSDDDVKAVYYGESTLGTSENLVLTQILNALQSNLTSSKLGLTQDQVSELNKPASFEQKTVEFKDGKMVDKSGNQVVNMILGLVVVFLMYMIVLTYSSIIATEVGSEKGSRIMEVILSSTTASSHFYGKIFGIFLVILLQVAVYGIMGVVGYFIVKDMDFAKNILEGTNLSLVFSKTLLIDLLFLLFGVILYVIIAALCGSLVSRQEDAPKAVVPVTYLTLAGFFIAYIVGMMNPDHIILKVSTYIPFFSPFVVPLRLGLSTMPTISIILSLVVLIVSCFIMLKISASIYKATVLVYSDGGMIKSLKESFSILKSEKAN